MLARIEHDWRSAGLSPARVAMLEYAETLTNRPAKVSQRHITALRSHGFTDRDILDICEATAYYAYANRIADGLGVSTESWLTDDQT